MTEDQIELCRRLAKAWGGTYCGIVTTDGWIVGRVTSHWGSHEAIRFPPHRSKFTRSLERYDIVPNIHASETKGVLLRWLRDELGAPTAVVATTGHGSWSLCVPTVEHTRDDSLHVLKPIAALSDDEEGAYVVAAEGVAHIVATEAVARRKG